MTLGQAVAAAIQAAGMTQVAIEDATGIDQGRLSKIVRGVDNRKPTLEELRKIEAACGLPHGYILGFAGMVTVAGVRRGAEAAAKLGRAR